MALPLILIPVISKVFPVLGAALSGPSASLVGSLISNILGVDMKNPEEMIKKISNDPESTNKLKELEIQLTDLQNARLEASKETGNLRFVRPIMAIFAMLAIFADIVAIEYVNDPVVSQILIIMMIFLIWDIRQIYKFYFGGGDDSSSIGLFKKKK